MARPHEPCHCRRCQGALVTHKTALRHALESQLATAIPTFDEWVNEGTGPSQESGMVGSSNVSVKLEAGSDYDVDLDEENKPAKRRRTGKLDNVWSSKIVY